MTHVIPTASTRRRELSPLAAGLLAIAGNMLVVGVILAAGMLALAAAAVVFGSALMDLV
ncbi:hypothetical protein [Microbacterium lushaniae]|uniref:hypothetical protein n=1 Tax=Microbacterium lushaniae TaxID=2614639 RepID=UPI0017871E91|nr:hypothetical protein [Microbacterium lushaniae]